MFTGDESCVTQCSNRFDNDGSLLWSAGCVCWCRVKVIFSVNCYDFGNQTM